MVLTSRLSGSQCSTFRFCPCGRIVFWQLANPNVIIHRSQQFKAVRVPLCWEQVWHVYMISAPILLIIGWLIWSSAKKPSEQGKVGTSVTELSRSALT